MPEGKEILRINLDETPVAQFHGYEAGNIFLPKKRRADVADASVQRVARGKLRSMLTHVAMICDDTEIQPLLPQILLTNEHIVSKRDAVAMQEDLPKNVLLWREKSSWTNVGVLVRILRRLRLNLAPVAAKYKVILSMDCARQHVPPRVAQVAAQEGFFLMYVPASLTWLLQPLDTHVFRRYKRILAAALQDARTKAVNGDLSTRMWVRCICLAVRAGLQGKAWKQAFADDGISKRQAEVSAYIRHILGGPVEHVSAERPSVEQLSVVFPRGMHIHEPSLFRAFDGRFAALPAIPDAAAGAAPVLKWSLRARAGADPPAAGPCPAPAAKRRGRRLTILGAVRPSSSALSLPPAALATLSATEPPPPPKGATEAAASASRSSTKSSSSKTGGIG